MTTDYDSPRIVDDVDTGSLEELQTRRVETAVGVIDMDEPDSEAMDLPGADLSGEALTVQVLPRQADEFTCGQCFLVHHRSRLAEASNGETICQDCY
jgi:hypothetical protein